MIIPFNKYPATRNDFIITDYRYRIFISENAGLINNIYNGRSGIRTYVLMLNSLGTLNDKETKYFDSEGFKKETLYAEPVSRLLPLFQYYQDILTETLFP
jgi:hypothetical protein